jgi:hypothetical protein
VGRRDPRRLRDDPGVISTVGRQNATPGGVRGLFQLLLVLVVVSLRYGG